MDSKIKQIINDLRSGNIVSMDTETVTGLFCLPKFNIGQKLNNLKTRDVNKPLQVMVGSWEDLFKITSLSKFQKQILEDDFPSSNSYIVNINSDFEKEAYVDNDDTILVRFPSEVEVPNLSTVLRNIGPLFATSANITNQVEFETAKEAANYFAINYLEDLVEKKGSSKIISLINDEIKIVRE